MAIPDGLKRVSLGSNKPPRRGPKPPKSRTKEIRRRVTDSFKFMYRLKTVSPTSKSTNADGFPRLVFTGYTFVEDSGTGHVGSTSVGSDIELTINTVNYDPSYYTLTINPTNIIIDFVKEAFLPNEEIESTDVVTLRARLTEVV